MGYTPMSSFPTTDDALKLFIPGQKISLKPFDDDRPEVSFTICKLSTPVTKSIVVMATPDAGDQEQVVIKIYDPRYFDGRFRRPGSSFPSYPWKLAHERAAAMARAENAHLSYEDLCGKRHAHRPNELSGDDLVAHCLFWEEDYYRTMMEAYDTEREAYRRLKAFQGSIIPRLIMAAQFLPLDERAIQPPALVLEYIPSVSLYDVPPHAITPAIRTQLLSAIASFPSHGIIHNDLNLNNIHFTPPDNPVKGIVIDFALAYIQCEDADEEQWTASAKSDTRWAKRLLEEVEVIKRPNGGARISRFL